MEINQIINFLFEQDFSISKFICPNCGTKVEIPEETQETTHIELKCPNCSTILEINDDVETKEED